MSDAVDNMEMYSMLNDQVLQQIKVSTDDGLKKVFNTYHTYMYTNSVMLSLYVVTRHTSAT